MLFRRKNLKDLFYNVEKIQEINGVFPQTKI